MKTKTLIFILCLVGIYKPILSQSKFKDNSRHKIQTISAKKSKTKKNKTILKRDLRIGWDISPIILGLITPKQFGIDLSVETQISHDIYGIIEGGYHNFSRTNTRVEYSSKGSYIRIGIDWNMRKSNHRNDEDILYLGGRYGYSTFEQEAPFFSITNEDWGNLTSALPQENAQAHWVEGVIGFKVEVLKNLFLGLGTRLKVLIYSKANKMSPPAYIPGYARNYNTLVFNINYNIYYNIPWNYKKQKIAVYE